MRRSNLVSRAGLGPVPLEYSTEELTCPIASKPVAVMVGWPSATQDRLLADVPGPRCGCAVVTR